MSGLFGFECCTCASPEIAHPFWLYRVVGGFPAYINEHSTANPLTYFFGTRWRKASYQQAVDMSFTDYCKFMGSPAAAVNLTVSGWPWCACSEPEDADFMNTQNVFGCPASYSFKVYSEVTDLINIPSSWVDAGSTVCGYDVADCSNACSYPRNGASTGGTSDGNDVYFGPFVGMSTGGIPSDPNGNIATLTCYFAADGYASLYGDAGDSYGAPAGVAFYDLITYGDGCGTGDASDFNDYFPYLSQCIYQDSCSEPSTYAYSGTAPAASGTQTETSYLGSASSECAVTISGYSSTNSCTSPISGIGTVSYSYLASAQGELSLEVDYDSTDASTSVYQSLLDNAAAASAIAATTCAGAGTEGPAYTFHDFVDAAPSYPDPCGSTSGYDGALVADGTYFTCDWYIPIVNSGWSFGLAIYEFPGDIGFTCIELIGTTCTQSTAPDTWIYATYIVMNDLTTFIPDTYGSGPYYVDGTGAFPKVAPIPSLRDLPAALYTDVDDVLAGPVGRITIVIPNTTAATWDHSTPFFP